jgi:phenylpropionate dioxygenase-like ring-hydroxylating dioxygenase large terminal subunit
MSDSLALEQTPWQSMFLRLLAETERRDKPKWDQAESHLRAAVYHDPHRHQSELAKLFRRFPLCLGHVDQFPEPGSMLAREIIGMPLLLIRDAAGSIGVFLNACRHRGARLLDEDPTVCKRSSLTCRYHGWTYDLAGALSAVPRREAFPTLDRATRGLRRLPCSVHHGLIWALLDPASTDKLDIPRHLGALDKELAALGVGQHRFFRQHAVRRAANWKLIVDAFLEVYHVKRLHSATIGPFFSDAISVSDHLGLHQRMLVAREQLAEELRMVPPERWSPQVHGTLVHLVFPNSVIVYHPDYISHLGIFPISPGESLFVHTMLVPQALNDDKAQAHWERSFDLIDGDVFNDEDLLICEQIQRGLTSAVDGDFVLGKLEENVRRFHETVEVELASDTNPRNG